MELHEGLGCFAGVARDGIGHAVIVFGSFAGRRINDTALGGGDLTLKEPRRPHRPEGSPSGRVVCADFIERSVRYGQMMR